MGSGRWDTRSYNVASSTRALKGIDDFAYSKATAAQPVHEQKAHPDLDPNGMKVRECRDSDEHPLSVPITVLFDVTGSMRRVPQALQKRLPDLLNMLLLSGYVADPQILMGSVGDAFSDRVPLQVGQYESDNRIDEQLRNIFLEGGGGGTYEESYDLGLYFAARHTALDCVEKRGEKGYLFLIGDEKPYREVRADVVKRVFGDDLLGGENVKIETIVKEAQEKFHVFFLIPGDTSHFNDPNLTATWEQLLGPNVIKIQNPEFVVETISTIVGLGQGTVEFDKAIEALKNTNPGAALGVENALMSYAKTLAPVPTIDDDPDGDTVRV